MSTPTSDNHPLLCRSTAIVLPLRLFPPATYYATMAAHPEARILAGARFDKRQKVVHRYRIADVRGPLELTMPIAHTPGAATAAGVRWCDVGLSAHGRWWEVHATALASAYGRTPFFEYYMPAFDAVFQAPQPGETLAERLLAADAAVRALLELPTVVSIDTTSTVPTPLQSCGATPPYWQVRADSLGFIPELSVLDLIFNLGPEAQLYLRDLQSAMGLR